MSTKHQDSGEKDPVWSLLGKSQTTKASPAFAQDVLRRVRQLDAAPATPWWKKLLAPAPLSAGALAAAAAVAFLVALPSDPAGTTPVLTDHKGETPAVTQLDQAFREELLIVAVDEPDLFSNAEILAMLY